MQQKQQKKRGASNSCRRWKLKTNLRSHARRCNLILCCRVMASAALLLRHMLDSPHTSCVQFCKAMFALLGKQEPSVRC